MNSHESAVRGVVVVFGPSGCGKTTIGKMIAEDLGWKFLEADDFHSVENRNKMGSGTPLTDADRLPWLQEVVQALQNLLREGATGVVLACSALKKAYRETLKRRVRERRDHFMPASLVASQLQTLELPDATEKDALVFDQDRTIKTIIECVRNHFRCSTANELRSS